MKAQKLDLFAVGTSCLIFLALTLYQLDLPGLYPDEAFDVIPTMQILLGHSVELQRDAGVHLFGLALPLMSSSDYQGVTSTYLALPFFALLGINVYALRLMTITVGLVALLLTFFLAAEWFGRPVARVAVLLLAVSPAWVFWSRLGVYVVSEVVPIAAGALLAFTVWVRRQPLAERNGPLYVGTFLLGLGLATKLLFIWMIVAVAGCALILYGRLIWESRGAWLAQARRWALIALAAGGAFCLGAFPFLLYNAMTRGTLYVLRANPGSTTHGVDNTAVMRNLWTEADAFRVLLDGSYFWFQGTLAAVYYNPLTPAVFGVSALGLLAFVLSRKSRAALQRRVAPLDNWRPFHLRSGAGITRNPPLLAAELGQVEFYVAGGKPVIARDAQLTVAEQAPAVLVIVAVALSVLLAVSSAGGSSGKVMVGLAIGMGMVGVGWATLQGLRREDRIAASGWLLLIAGAITGASWWFGGSGRPDGPAPGGLLGLWPVDAAGVLFWLCGLGLVLVLGMDRHPVALQRAVVASLTIIGLVVAQSAVTLSGLWATHLLLVLPLPQVVIAAFVMEVARLVRTYQVADRPGLRRRVLHAGVVLGVTALVALDLVVAVRYHRDMSASGGGSTFSDAIYSLADYLDAQDPRPEVVAMDWGFKRPLQFLTHERVNPLEAYGYTAEATAEFRQGLHELLARPDTLYLFHTEQGTAYHRREAFMDEVRKAGKQAVLVKAFSHRDGVPNYEVYVVR
ncbi:MAG: ArnT family glycosyltransferase [Chloroflexia bacterium]